MTSASSPIFLASTVSAAAAVAGRPTASLSAFIRPPFLLASGEEIYSQGDVACHLYCVEFGAVRIFRLLADGRRQISSFHLPGEVFGFEADGFHHFFADAISLTGVRSIPRARENMVTSEIMNCAFRCLVRTQEHLLVLGRQSAIERVAAFLLDMAERQGGLEQFDLPMSRSDIGDYLGLTIETVSRVISKLRAQHVIRLISSRTVEIESPAALRALCN